MIKITFTQEDIDRLYEGHLNHASQRTRKKLLAVYLKSMRVEHDLICKICRISWPTMVSYLKEYRDGGFERVTINMHRGHPSELNAHRQEIRTAFEVKCPATLKEAKARIKEISGIERSLPQVWSFLHKLGLRPRKVGGVPGKVDVDAQETFKKKNLNRGLRKLKPGNGRCIL